MNKEIATLEVNHTSVYADGDYLFPQMMAEAMGLDWNAQRERIKRSPWSEGMTSTVEVILPTDTKGATKRFKMHQRIVPMWIATIDTRALALIASLITGVVGAVELHTVGTWLNAVNQVQTSS